METLREQHSNLESQAAQRFSELLKQRKQNLILATEDENHTDCEIVSVYSESLGREKDVYVIEITKEGMIKGTDVEDETCVNFYRFSDLSSLLDRINIVEILEYNQNN